MTRNIHVDYVYEGCRTTLASSTAGPDRCDPTPDYLAEFREPLARELRQPKD